MTKLQCLKLIKKLEKTYKEKNFPSGVQGFYIRINSKVGVKIYHGEFSRKTDLKVSDDLYKANNAHYYMNKFSKINKAPKSYGVYPIKLFGSYHVCMIMEHITGRHRELSQIEDIKLQKILDKYKTCHGDIWEMNLKVQRNGNVVLLDWDHAEKWQ